MGPWDDQVSEVPSAGKPCLRLPSPPAYQGAGCRAGPEVPQGPAPSPLRAKPGDRLTEGQASVGSSRTQVCSAHSTEVRRDSWEAFLEEGTLEARVPGSKAGSLPNGTVRASQRL